jgi:hypothetical protein
MRHPRHLTEPRICVVRRVTDLLDEGPSQARLRASGEAITNGCGDAKAP